ncbi:MAG: STAS domain-containing protein [Actinomycetota bacterium]
MKRLQDPGGSPTLTSLRKPGGAPAELSDSYRVPASRVQVESRSGAIRVSFHGELDLASAPLIKEALPRGAGCGGWVLLDVDGMSFMDCTGLLSILELASDVRASGGVFAIANCPPQARRVFQLTEQEELLDTDLLAQVLAHAGDASNGNRQVEGAEQAP